MRRVTCPELRRGGKEYSGMQQTFSSPPSYAKGEKLTVLYNPADPQESYPDNLLDNYFGCLVGGVFGLVTLLIGFSYLLASRLKARKTAQ